MSQGRPIMTVLVTLVIGFVGGFALRPVIAPTAQTTIADVRLPASPVSSEPRGAQYFKSHIGEARQVVAGCRDGSIRGGECATADEAIIKVESAERRKRFLSN